MNTMKPFIIVVKRRRRLHQKCVLIIYPFFSIAQTKNPTSHSLFNGNDSSGSNNEKAYITPFLSNPIEYQKYAFMLKSFRKRLALWFICRCLAYTIHSQPYTIYTSYPYPGVHQPYILFPLLQTSNAKFLFLFQLDLLTLCMQMEWQSFDLGE